MVNFKQIILAMMIYSLFSLRASANEGHERYFFSLFDNNTVIIDEITPKFKQIPKLLLIGFTLEQIANKTLDLTDNLTTPPEPAISPRFKPSFILNDRSTFEDLLKAVIYFSAEDSSDILLYNLQKKYADFENKMQNYLTKLELSNSLTQNKTLELEPRELISLQVKLLTLYPYYSKLVFTDNININQISQKNPNIIIEKPEMQIIITSKTYQEGSWFVTFLAKAQNWNITGIVQQINEHFDIDKAFAAITDKIENVTNHYKSYKLFNKGQQLLLDYQLPNGQKITINAPQDIIIIERNDLDRKKIKATLTIHTNSPEELSSQLVLKLPEKEMVFPVEIKKQGHFN